MTEPTTQALIELADKYAFFMPGSAEGAKVREQLLDAIEAQARQLEGVTDTLTSTLEILKERDAAIEAQDREIERLQVEAEQLRKGHFDVSETASVLSAELAAIRANEVKWEGAEGWEQLAWQLCAEENGEDACNELIWEGGPIPEPWGDRWLKYEDEAKRLIKLVREYAPVVDVNAGLVEALEQIVQEKCDYMLRNKLGNPEIEHTTRQARAALTAAKQAQPERAPLTLEQCKAKFEAWYASAPDAEPEPDRTYELSDESMSELTKDCIWLGWQAALTQQAQKGGK